MAADKILDSEIGLDQEQFKPSMNVSVLYTPLSKNENKLIFYAIVIITIFVIFSIFMLSFPDQEMADLFGVCLFQILTPSTAINLFYSGFFNPESIRNNYIIYPTSQLLPYILFNFFYFACLLIDKYLFPYRYLFTLIPFLFDIIIGSIFTAQMGQNMDNLLISKHLFTNLAISLFIKYIAFIYFTIVNVSKTNWVSNLIDV